MLGSGLSLMPTTETKSSQFGNESVILMLEWTGEHNNLSSYSVDIFPQANVVVNNRSARLTLQIELLYNTLYNVSIIASLCGINSSSFVELHYGELYSVAIIVPRVTIFF